MHRRELFKLLGVAPAALILAPGVTEAAKRGGFVRDHNYGRLMFTTPHLMFHNWAKVEKDLKHARESLLIDLDPLAEKLADAGKRVWHAGWIDADGFIWRRSEEMDQFTAIFGVYAQTEGKSRTSAAYNRGAIVTAFNSSQVYYHLRDIHHKLGRQREGR